MGRILLVRHAQASFGGADYDRLSATGEQQARLLGEHWAGRRLALARMYSGPRRRQQDTARLAAEAARASGLELPEPVVSPDFDEYHGEAVMAKSLPRLREHDPEVRRLEEALTASAGDGERVKNFQRLFEAVIGRWAEGRLDVPEIESWPQFCARVKRGLAQVAAEGRGQQVAVFCSGGPVAVAMQHALDLSPQKALQTGWMVRNCACSEFWAAADRFTLSSFNEVPHLDEALLTYR